MTRQERDHLRYMENRDERIEKRRIYVRDYQKKGISKPRTPRDPERRKRLQHERYMLKRDEILAYQKKYRETHREEINERHRRWRMARTVEKLRQYYRTL